MNYTDISEAKKVWDQVVSNIKNGKIVKEVRPNGNRVTYFPGKKDNRISHVRPHAQNRDDTYPLPSPDKKTGLTDYTKHCFWLNASYVRDEIYLK